MTGRDPTTRYAQAGDVHIAYQVTGDGPTDLLVVDSWVHHVEIVWQIPELARSLRRLGSFARVIHFDRRGTGLSDQVPLDALPTLETQVDDACAVLDAAGSSEAVVFGIQDGTLVATLMAATRPDRCSGLVLYSGAARGHSWPEEEIEDMVRMIASDLARGGGRGMSFVAPSRVGDEDFTVRYARLERSSVRPGAVGHFFRQSMTSGVEDIAHTIRVPTLLLHRSSDQVVPIEAGRQLGRLIEGAVMVEFPGEDHLFYAAGTDDMVDEIEEFVTGSRGVADPDLVLATFMFTDIVDSTRMAAELGDRRWKALLDRHHELIRHEIERYGGEELDTTGDGFLVMFDRPARAVRCGLGIHGAVRSLGVDVRVGAHIGEVEIRGKEVTGLAVHIAARVAALAEAGEVLVTSTMRDLVADSAVTFTSRGEHRLKGVPDAWRLFVAVETASAATS